MDACSVQEDHQPRDNHNLRGRVSNARLNTDAKIARELTGNKVCLVQFMGSGSRITQYAAGGIRHSGSTARRGKVGILDPLRRAPLDIVWEHVGEEWAGAVDQ